LADRIFVLSTRPAQISFELSICLPRPRDLTHPEVVAATERILRELGLENEQEELLTSEEIRKR
jgi:ABC-type nitrate/sulfonate/bicarbonate transport system ATPase subunit